MPWCLPRVLPAYLMALIGDTAGGRARKYEEPRWHRQKSKVDAHACPAVDAPTRETRKRREEEKKRKEVLLPAAPPCYRKKKTQATGSSLLETGRAVASEERQRRKETQQDTRERITLNTSKYISSYLILLHPPSSPPPVASSISTPSFALSGSPFQATRRLRHGSLHPLVALRSRRPLAPRS